MTSYAAVLNCGHNREFKSHLTSGFHYILSLDSLLLDSIVPLLEPQHLPFEKCQIRFTTKRNVKLKHL